MKIQDHFRSMDAVVFDILGILPASDKLEIDAVGTYIIIIMQEIFLGFIGRK